jgi:DNA-binding MarR family transcriptional regulator
LLRELYERGEAAPKEMAEALAMTRGAVSKIVDKLEAKGWISIRSTPLDGRVQVLSLTRRGRRVVPVMARIADQNDQRFFGCLTANERDVLGKLLVKLAECHHIQGVPVD